MKNMPGVQYNEIAMTGLAIINGSNVYYILNTALIFRKRY
jgi:hypothetical protein